jgi:antitoxin component of RelBE/YafQ-DinJ toxin-antitoxin module
MTKRNLTLYLDESLIRKARAFAAKKGMTLTQLIADRLEKVIDEERQFEANKETKFTRQ